MNNEIRNELLIIRKLMKSETNEDKQFQLQYLLERFENDIKRQLEDLQYQEKQLLDNLETLKYVKKELEVK